MLFLLPHLTKLVERTEKIGIGNFQLTVRQLALNSGITTEEIKDLNGLTYDELRFFLIKGGEHANDYIFEDNSMTTDKWIKTHETLQTKELIEIIKFDSIKREENGRHYYEYYFNTNTTSKGEKIHRAILDAIYQNFIISRLKTE